MTRGVRIPQITDLKTAIKTYYSRFELSNTDIKKLFGVSSDTTVGKLKRLATEKMAEKNIPFRNPLCVNTEAAYEAWELDIDSLKKRYMELQSLNL